MDPVTNKKTRGPGVEDNITWRFEASGLYSAKSAYEYAIHWILC
jgi:hypothetical protein